MDSILRSVFIYLFLLLFTSLTGKRTLAQVTVFDFILLLIISEATQQGRMGEDFSVINAMTLILTLLSLDVILSFLQRISPRTERFMNGTPLILIENGRPLKDRMDRARVDESDIMEAARKLRGLARMEEVKYAVLEKDGGITVIPWDSDHKREPE